MELFGIRMIQQCVCVCVCVCARARACLCLWVYVWVSGVVMRLYYVIDQSRKYIVIGQ